MEEKIQFSASDLLIRQITLEDNIDLASFSCGDNPEYNELNHFFQSSDIFLCAKYHYYSVYVVRHRLTSELLAVFTLANDTILLKTKDEKEDLTEEVRPVVADEYNEIWDQQTSYPAIVIGHLGVCSRYQSSHIGSILIGFILTTFEKYNITGCQFITVDALNNQRTNKFYLREGFSYLTNTDSMSSTRRMYMPLNCVKNG